MDPRQKLADAVWLDDVVVRAELEPHHPVDLLAPRADDDDRHAGALSKPPADLQAVQVGQTEVEQNEVCLPSVEGSLSRRGAVDLESLPREALEQRLGNRVLVLDDQNSHESMVAAAPGSDIRAFPNLYRTLAEAWFGALPQLTGAGLPSLHRIDWRPG
jgi:hypothetical protein